MEKLNKKYIEDFEQLVRDFEKLKVRPSSDTLHLVMQDLQQIQSDLRNIKL